MMFLGVRLGTHNPNQIDKYRPGALLFPHCLAERQCDQTLTNRIKFDVCYCCPYSVPNSPYSNLSTDPSRSSSVLSGTQSRLEAYCLSTYLLLPLAIMLLLGQIRDELVGRLSRGEQPLPYIESQPLTKTGFPSKLGLL
jgi:hypothetical protein